MIVALFILFFFFTCVITAHISYVCQKEVEIEATVGTGSPKTGMEKIFQSCPISVKLYILWCLFLAERIGKQCGLLSVHFLCCLERKEIQEPIPADFWTGRQSVARQTQRQTAIRIHNHIHAYEQLRVAS